MKSVALLPTHGDPFMLRHFLVNYDRVWRGEVDELHVLVSGQPDPEVMSEEAIKAAHLINELPEGRRRALYAELVRLIEFGRAFVSSGRE